MDNQIKFDPKTKSTQIVNNQTFKGSVIRHKQKYDPIKEIPLNFIAIDFETANNNRCSPCSVGVAIVKDREIVGSFGKLIKPHKDYSHFDDFNISIHGITPTRVKDSPEFNNVMNEIYPLLDGNLIVAHNMPFDSSVLCQTIKLYGIKSPTSKTLCSVCISKLAYPQLVSHRLDVVSDYLKIEVDHHNPESDAIACARIIIEATKTNSERIISSGYSYGYISEEGHWSPQILNRDIKEHKLPDDWTEKADKTSILDDCDFVFTGTLSSMPRRVAHELVQRAGGRANETINKETEFLVMGTQDYSKFADGQKSNKTKKAGELRAKGYPIEIISEDDFLKMFD